MAKLDCVPVKLRTIPLDTELRCGVYTQKTTDDGVTGEQVEYVLLVDDVTLTQSMIDRLKRKIFPATKVYIPRKFVIDGFFNKGVYLEFSEPDIKAIRNGENPWEAKKKLKIVLSETDKKKKEDDKNKKDENKPKTVDAKKINVAYNANKRKIREVIRVYDKTKSDTLKMLDNAAKTGRIDPEEGKVLTKNIQDQIDTTDVSLIIQTINRIRTVDEYLHTHCLNVAFLNGLMGKWLGYSPEKQNDVVEVGLFHDLGKLSIDKSIIHKSDGALTASETLEMQKHPVLSVEMLIKSGVRNKPLLEGIGQHHERINGTGYPMGITMKEIGEYARITAISDTYDAMVTKRVHADSHSPFVILGEFDRGGYSELDFHLVEIFISCMIDELKGKEVIMNDGREATVLLINPNRLLYPIVECDGVVVTTNDDFYCVRMKNILN